MKTKTCTVVHGSYQYKAQSVSGEGKDSITVHLKEGSCFVYWGVFFLLDF